VLLENVVVTVAVAVTCSVDCRGCT
jgi:hypothetical protein